MLLLSVPLGTNASAANNVSLTADKSTANVGDQITVTLYVEGLCGVTGQLSWSHCLSFTNFTRAYPSADPVMEDYTIVVNEVNGKLNFADANNTNQAVGIFTFTAVASGEATVNLYNYA